MADPRFKALLLAASLLTPVAAHAQSLLISDDDGARATVTFANSVVAAEPAAADAAAPAARTAGRLMPFREPAADFVLSGESDVEEFTFRLDAGQAEAGGNLVLAYQNAVSVLPDDGVMSVEINGKPAGDYPIVSPFDFTRQRIPVSAKLLQRGTNTVRVSVSQHHRVDCSLDATYELWTRLSPQLSGFETKSAPSFAGFEDLHSIGRMEDGATELRLILPNAANADMLNSASAIVQALTLYLGRQDVVVTVADKAGEGPGIDLYAGVMGVDPTDAGGMRPYADAAYGVTVEPSADPERATVIFRAASTEQLQQLLLEAVRGPMAAGLKASREAKPFGVVQAVAEKQFTLKDAGIRSSSFGGRLMRTHFNVVMPADFYAAEYATFDLKLSAAAAPGLDPSSQMLVRVNDRVVNSFPFRNTDGQNFNGKLIELPLRAFHPGVNKVEMLAELPNAGDKACAPQTRNDAKPRYVLLDNTTFSVPPLARVTRLPDLAAFAGNAYPYGAGKPFDIYLRGADSHSASAAMTVLARLAMTSGAPVKGVFQPGSAPVGAVDALVISANASQASDVTGPAAQDVAGRFAIDDRAAGLMNADRVSTAAIVSNARAQSDDGSDQLIQAFEDSNAENGAGRSWTARLKSLLASMTGQFGSWLKYDDVKPTQISAANTLLTITQTARNGAQGTLTEIHAASPDDLSKGIRRLANPAVWSTLTGSAALIDNKTMDVMPMPGQDLRFVEVTDQSIGNYRRIAAAWLSDNFRTYVVLVIVLVGLFSAWLGKLVQRKGVRTVK
jgi:hypothetical protein